MVRDYSAIFTWKTGASHHQRAGFCRGFALADSLGSGVGPNICTVENITIPATDTSDSTSTSAATTCAYRPDLCATGQAGGNGYYIVCPNDVPASAVSNGAGCVGLASIPGSYLLVPARQAVVLQHC